MFNQDIIIIILLIILCISLFYNNRELFLQKSSMYPISASENPTYNTVENRLGNIKLRIFNNLLQKVKENLNSQFKENPYFINKYESIKKNIEIPDTKRLANRIVGEFNRVGNKIHKIRLISTSIANVEI